MGGKNRLLKDLNIRPRFRAIIVKVQASTIPSEKDLHKALRNVPAVIIYLLQPEKRVGNFTFTFKPAPLSAFIPGA